MVTSDNRTSPPGRKQPIGTAEMRNGRPAQADRPSVMLAFSAGRYWTLNWALVLGVVPQSYSCRSEPLLALGPWTFRQRPEATFLKA